MPTNRSVRTNPLVDNDIAWCTECGQVLIYDFMRDALACPRRCPDTYLHCESLWSLQTALQRIL
jgi:hypothetical protein